MPCKPLLDIPGADVDASVVQGVIDQVSDKITTLITDAVSLVEEAGVEGKVDAFIALNTDREADAAAPEDRFGEFNKPGKDAGPTSDYKPYGYFQQLLLCGMVMVSMRSSILCRK